MSSNIPLDNLIEALAGAVIEAQDNVEQHQLKNLTRYFDKDRRPKSLLMRVPSIRPDAEENEYDLYRAPLLPLMSMNILKIKDVEITFDAELGQMLDEPAEEGDDKKNGKSPKSVSVNIAGARSDKAGSIHICLRVEGSEPTDGAARLMNHLAQTQGVFRKG
jgi:hypothetical protein